MGALSVSRGRRKLKERKSKEGKPNWRRNSRELKYAELSQHQVTQALHLSKIVKVRGSCNS